MKISVTYTGQLIVSPECEGEVFNAEEEIEKAFDRTMEALLKLDVEDPSVCGTISTGQIEIACTVKADNPADAMGIADSSIRSALHEAGVFTPGWNDTPLRQIEFRWQEASLGEVNSQRDIEEPLGTCN